MNGARERVLGAVRRSLGRGSADAEARAAVEARLADHPRGLIPARSALPRAEQIALFIAQATAQVATVARVPDLGAVPEAVAGFLKAENLPAALRLAPDPLLSAVAWERQPLLEIASGRAVESDQVSVTAAFAGVAETGTLVLHSGPAGPTTLNFLPETNIVVLKASTVVGSYEEAWDRLRDVFGPGVLPRTVNLITGPSRTADIEQTLQIGAHGPRRLHIILVDDEGGQD